MSHLGSDGLALMQYLAAVVGLEQGRGATWQGLRDRTRNLPGRRNVADERLWLPCLASAASFSSTAGHEMLP